MPFLRKIVAPIAFAWLCMHCSNESDTEPYDASDVAGDTFACRLYHLTAAATLPEVHCPHILPASAPCA